MPKSDNKSVQRNQILLSPRSQKLISTIVSSMSVTLFDETISQPLAANVALYIPASLFQTYLPSASAELAPRRIAAPKVSPSRTHSAPYALLSCFSTIFWNRRMNRSSAFAFCSSTSRAKTIWSSCASSISAILAFVAEPIAAIAVCAS